MAEIKVLGDLEHVKLRPGMYIGNVFSPDHLAQEIIDNSLDELANKFASTITIDVPEQNQVIITDDGRGIPVHPVEVNGKMVDSIIAACTKLFSGAKFDESTYGFAIGLHGVGLVAVNALSSEMAVTVRDRENHKIYHHYEFQNSILVDKKSMEVGQQPWNTRIAFRSDPQYFTMNKFNVERFYERMALVSCKFPTSNIIINGKPVPKGTLEQFARYQLDIPDDVPIFHIVSNGTPNNRIDAFFTYDLISNAAPIVKGDVNLHICGGTYQTNFQTLLFNALNKKHTISRNEALSNLRAYISIITSKPEFDSQSKANMTRNLTGEFSRCQKNLEEVLNHSYLKTCIDTILKKKSIQRASRKIVQKKRISAQNGFKDCLKSPGEYLYIMEGKSADGSLSQIRNKQIEAILPISGKILNVTKSSVERAVDNKKFKFLLEVLGVQLNNRKQPSFRYNKVRILCDADPDGLHIAVLVTLGLWYYAPEIIRQKRASIILPPLYGAIKGKNFVPIYDHQTVNNYPGHQIVRFKGIGEMSPEQLEVVIRHNCIEYVLNPPANQAENDNIIRCITDTDLKRRLCEDSRFALETLFSFTNQPDNQSQGHVASLSA